MTMARWQDMNYINPNCNRKISKRGKKMANTKLSRYPSYISPVKCGNCRNETKKRIPIGVAIEKMVCPKCGMKELHHPSYFHNKLFP